MYIEDLTLPRKIDLEGKGYVDQATIISAVRKDGEASNYDEIRATLRDVNIDASGRVELEDYIEASRSSDRRSWLARFKVERRQESWRI